MNPNQERDEKLASLILTRDVERIAWGAELARAIGEAPLFDAMLRGVSWAPPAHPYGYGTLHVRGFCARSNTRRRWDLVRATALLAGAPPECETASRVIASMTSLDLDRSLPAIPEDGCDLAPLADFAKLARLRVRASSEPRNLDALARMASLEELTLHAPVKELAPLSGASSLRSLAVRSQALLSVDGLRDLPSLRELDLSDCKRLSSFAFVRALPTLTSLSLAHTSAVEVDLAPLATLSALRHLNLRCPGETRDGIAPLSSLAALESLAVEGLGDVRSLAALRALPRLREITWWGDDFEALDLDGAPSLQSLSIEGTYRDVTRDLEALRGLDLRTLRLSAEVACHDLSALGASRELSRLSLVAPRLGSLDGVSLASLTHCEVMRGDLDDVSALAKATGLRWLSLRDCKRVRDVSALDALTQLRGVNLTGTAVRPESLPPRLRAIAVFGAHDPLSALASRVDAIDEPTPRGLSEAARVEWPRVIALLRSFDEATVERGVALVRAIGDASLYHALLRGVQWRRRHLDPEHGYLSLRDSRLRVPRRGTSDLSRLALTFAAEAPDACRAAWALRQRVTGLRLSRPGLGLRDLDATPLGAFTELRSLALDDVKVLTNGASLDALTSLESLSVRGSAVPVEFDPARWPKLRACSLKGARYASIPRVLRAPALRELSLSYTAFDPSDGPLVIEGHTTLAKLTATLSSAKGEVTVRACPALEELELTWFDTLRLFELRGCPALRSFVSHNYGFSKLGELRGIDELTALRALECDETFALEFLSRAPHLASRIERLSLRNATRSSCELIAAFRSLRALTISWSRKLTDVSALASITSLTSLELRWCQSLTNLDALEGLPLTRLVVQGTPIDRARLPPSLARVLVTTPR